MGVLKSSKRRGGDEAFWRRQEGRRKVTLMQPCCTLSGMCHLLGRMVGNFAVVIHGERDCGNAFTHHWMPGAGNFFCTNLSETQVLGGQANGVLADALRLVLAERRPEAVFVLTTCLIQLTGSDPERVVRAAARPGETPVVLLRTGGLKMGTQADMADWLYSTLASLPQSRESGGTRGRGLRCNLIGLPSTGLDEGELRDVLGAGGIEVNGIFPATTKLDDWRRISRAGVNFVADRSLYPRLMSQLQKGYGLSCVDVPVPVGLEQTLRFYKVIGGHFGTWTGMERALGAALKSFEKPHEAFRARARGRRVAFGLRMHNDFRPDALAHGGLAEASALADLGFDIALIIQGPVEEQEEFRALLARQNCRLPQLVVPHPWDLAPILRAGRFDAALMPEHCLEEAQRAGLPLVVSRELRPLLSGVPHNLALLDAFLGPPPRRVGAAA